MFEALNYNVVSLWLPYDVTWYLITNKRLRSFHIEVAKCWSLENHYLTNQRSHNMVTSSLWHLWRYHDFTSIDCSVSVTPIIFCIGRDYEELDCVIYWKGGGRVVNVNEKSCPFLFISFTWWRLLILLSSYHKSTCCLVIIASNMQL